MRRSQEGAEDGMADLREAQRKLNEADRAASNGDLASADSLLREAAEIQEAELGPLHPDLANTLNNLGVVAERTERPGEAESFYRRANAIATASLPADHPMVVDSRQNLVEFCRARGLTVDPPVVLTAAAPITKPKTSAVSSERSTLPPADTQPPTPATRSASRTFLWMAAGVVALAVVVFALTRPQPLGDTQRDTTTEAPRTLSLEPTVVPAPSAAPEPAPPPPPARAIVENSPAPTIESREPNPDVAPTAPRASSLPAGSVSIVTAELCQNFAAGGAEWRCDPVGDTVAPGRLVFYTRVRSPRDTDIVHLWYHGDAPPQSSTMTIRANPGEGYRTYSRRTVDVAGDWRVEVRTMEGDLLRERRFSVR